MRFLFKKIITWICFFVGLYLFIKYGYILPKFDFIINLLIVILLGLLIVLFIVITILKKYYSNRRKYHYYSNSSFKYVPNHDSSKEHTSSDFSFKYVPNHDSSKEHTSSDFGFKYVPNHDSSKEHTSSDFELKNLKNAKSEDYVYDEKSGIWIPHSESNSENFHHMSKSEIWIPHSEDSLVNIGINKSFISSSAETNKETYKSGAGYRNSKIVHKNANNRNPSNIKIEIRNFVVSVLSGIIASIFFHYLSDLLNWH